MSTRPPREKLGRARVIEAAIALADAGGLEAASMRAVAESLDVTPMALYKHVDNRSHLVDGMLDHVLGGVSEPPGIHDWQDAVRARILAVRHLTLAHPWMREAIESRSSATPRVLAHMDALMATMFAGGLSADLVHHAMHALSTRMWGFTRDVLPTPAAPEDEPARARAFEDFAVFYPAIVRMASTASHAGAACDDDAEFLFALELLLTGVARLHASGWAPRDRV